MDKPNLPLPHKHDRRNGIRKANKTLIASKMHHAHVLNGDCLAAQLKAVEAIRADVVVCRECLIEGNVNADSLENFWKVRADFIASSFDISADNYYQKTVAEFDKLANLPKNSTINLWFEDDLFCQTNMWFTVSLLSETQPTATLYRVFPVVNNDTDIWKGFGISTAKMLQEAYQNKVIFEFEDILLAKSLWAAYQNADFEKLEVLSNRQSKCFHYLPEVCKAHIDRFPTSFKDSKPERIIKNIIQAGAADFNAVFSEFSKKAGIYGFGDTQLKAIYDKVLQNQ